jgi:hypothetical protein
MFPLVLPALGKLEVELAERGRELLFTTPRGDIEITARACRSTQIERFRELLGVVAVAAAAYFSLARCP